MTTHSVKIFKRFLTAFFMIAALAGFNPRLFAKPSLLGTSGLVMIPTAASIPQGSFSMALVRPNISDLNRKPNEQTPLKVFAYGFQYGLTKEIEFAAMQNQIESAGTKTMLSVKYALFPESAKSPGVSIGTIYEPSDSVLYYQDISAKSEARTSLYAVASHTLQFPEEFAKKYTLRGHVGMGNKRIDGLFAGLDVQFSKVVKFSAEYDSSSYNYGLDVFLSPAIVLSGFTQKDRFGFGLSVSVMPKK